MRAKIAYGLCAVVVGMALLGSGQASAQEHSEVADPLQPVNRVIFRFNEILDRVLIDPVSKVYRAVLPEPVREGVKNVMQNLRAPLNVANEVLQGDIKGAAKETGRFVVNTTVGIGGLFDVAENHLDWKYEREDFGQTLGKWGVGDGFYVVLPVLGPSTLRDTAGLAADSYADPLRIWAFNTDRENIYYGKVLLDGLDTRARLIYTLEDLRRNSIDYYATVRSIYIQKRAAMLNDTMDNGNSYVIPDYDDYDDVE